MEPAVASAADPRGPAPADPFRLWNEIGASFDATRSTPWQVVADWIDALPERSRLLDLMGGNGRHAHVARSLGHRVVVADWSRPLTLSARRHGDTVLADATRLPFQDGCMDAAMYVAGLHGLPAPQDRQASIAGLGRVLVPGAPVLVTVWSHNSPQFSDGLADIEVPWRRDGHHAMRTYHLYTPRTLEAALTAGGFLVRSCEDVRLGGQTNVVAWAIRP